MHIASLTRTILTIIAFSATSLAAEGMQGMMVHDPYLRSSTEQSTSGAAYMILMNHTGADDRLIGATSDVAGKIELHTHTEDANGIMRMGEIEGGVAIPNDAAHGFERGADHLMFMGLTQPLVQGQIVTVTLEFEKAGTVVVEFPVDRARRPGQSTQDHTMHDHTEHDMKSD